MVPKKKVYKSANRSMSGMKGNNKDAAILKRKHETEEQSIIATTSKIPRSSAEEAKKKMNYVFNTFGPQGGLRKSKSDDIGTTEDVISSESYANMLLCDEDEIETPHNNIAISFDLTTVSQLENLEQLQNALLLEDERGALFKNRNMTNISKKLSQTPIQDWSISRLRDLLQLTRALMFKVLKLIFPFDPLSLFKHIQLEDFFKDASKERINLDGTFVNEELSKELEVKQKNKEIASLNGEIISLNGEIATLMDLSDSLRVTQENLFYHLPINL